MKTRAFGETGLTVSVLGFGAGQIGDAAIGDAEVDRLIGAVLDVGITFFDTARSYGASEERLGRALEGRRDVVISTKGGYGVEGAQDWTAEAVARGIDEALVRLRRERIDVFHLHSCPREVLLRGEVIAPLERAKEAGKIHVIAYSGENDALDFAVASRRFSAVQCSVNAFDQRSLHAEVRRASARGMGVVAKRALGNAPWRFAERPHGDYAETYWTRMRAMDFDPAPLAWAELAVRFAAYSPGVSCALVGSRDAAHVKAAARAAERGPLPDDVSDRLGRAFAANDQGWIGQI